jgi:hypothetical protein
MIAAKRHSDHGLFQQPRAISLIENWLNQTGPVCPFPFFRLRDGFHFRSSTEKEKEKLFNIER